MESSDEWDEEDEEEEMNTKDELLEDEDEEEEEEDTKALRQQGRGDVTARTGSDEMPLPSGTVKS